MKGEVQILTLDGVKAAARKAYDEKRLLAQTYIDGEPLPAEMFRTIEGNCCAIGAALSEETLSALQESNNLSGTIYGLLSRGQVRVSPPGPRTADAITEIMIAHDRIIGEPHRRDRLTAEFLRLIDYPATKPNSTAQGD